MHLVIDANVIVGNPLLRGRQWDAVAHAVWASALIVAVPELAIEEAVARYRDASAARRRALRKQLRLWPPAARSSLEAAIDESSEFEADYPRLLRQRLKQMNAVILGYPEVSHRDVALLAINRRAPFDGEGNGYRDALHWMSVLELLTRAETADRVLCLLSADKKAFGPARQAQLQADVEARAPDWRVQFESDIGSFAVPGRFFDDDRQLTARQEEQLYEAIVSAIQLGGESESIFVALAQRAGFDDAWVSEAQIIDVELLQVKAERASADLWIEFKAVAECEVQFETVDQDGALGERASYRDTRIWTLLMAGEAWTSHGAVQEIYSLDLDERASDPIDTQFEH